jgi:hypothetical protein
MSEEETRESLRRFLREWQKLIGADPQQLTLVQELAHNDGTKTAVYEQKPFSYPLRGDYGRVEVHFAADRRILSLSSTAIPESQRIQTALTAAAPRAKGQELLPKLIGRSFTYSDSAGQHSYAITAANQPSLQQLVVYPRVISSNPTALEFHLAWEVSLNNAPVKTIYVDALQEEVMLFSN